MTQETIGNMPFVAARATENSTQAKTAPSYLDERSFGKSIRQHVKEFGGLFGLIALVVFAIALYKQLDALWLMISGAAACTFLYTGYLAPTVLYPIWKTWMGLAHYMGMVMTFVILSICWTVMLVPMATALKIIGKKVMDTTFDPSLDTYWVDRSSEKHDFLLLEKQY